MRHAGLAVTLCALVAGSSHAAADTAATPVVAEVQTTLPARKLAGTARLKVWGFQVYDASLWVAPRFRRDDYTAHAFALELRYLRDFSAAALARQSIEEIRRNSPAIDDAQALRWEGLLQASFFDVKKGQRITGIYQPASAGAAGPSATFVADGLPATRINDPELAKLFFGIWLSPNTSQPDMRRELLAGADAPR